MTETDEAPSPGTGSTAGPSLYASAYRFFAYFGLFSISGVLLWGFRHQAEAPAANFAFDAGLYALFLVPHLVMTRSWFKRAVWGRPEGHPRERRVYIAVTVVTWLGLIALHRPLPGGELVWPFSGAVTFAGFVFFVWFMKLFFEGVPFEAIDGLLGVPGSVSAFSHGPETPLYTEGRYAKVRHPMYQAFFLFTAASLIIHPNVAQLFWAVLLSGSFVAFIPVEEAQMLQARGEDYREYMRTTPWRVLPGVW